MYHRGIEERSRLPVTRYDVPRVVYDGVLSLDIFRSRRDVFYVADVVSKHARYYRRDCINRTSGLSNASRNTLTARAGHGSATGEKRVRIRRVANREDVGRHNGLADGRSFSFVNRQARHFTRRNDRRRVRLGVIRPVTYQTDLYRNRPRLL